MAGGPMNPPVVKSGFPGYEVRPREDHRNVGFECAAVWSAVVAKVTGAIGYARHQSRSRDALIREGSMRYKNFVVFTAFGPPCAHSFKRSRSNVSRQRPTYHWDMDRAPLSNADQSNLGQFAS